MGGHLKGNSPARIRFLREIMESLPGPLISREKIPSKENLLRYQTALRSTNPSDPMLKLLCSLPVDILQSFHQKNRLLESSCGNAAILQYYGTQCTNKAKIELPNDQPYTISVIDSWNMTKMIVMTHAKGSVTVPMPSREGIAVLAIPGH